MLWLTHEAGAYTTAGNLPHSQQAIQGAINQNNFDDASEELLENANSIESGARPVIHAAGTEVEKSMMSGPYGELLSKISEAKLAYDMLVPECAFFRGAVRSSYWIGSSLRLRKAKLGGRMRKEGDTSHGCS